MSSRVLATVLIQVLGVGLIAFAILTGCVTAATLSDSRKLWRELSWFMVSYPLVALLIGVFLIRQADWIAERMGADVPAPDGRALDAAALFRVGSAVIGVYCLTRLAGPVTTLAYELTRSHPSGLESEVPSLWRRATTSSIEIGVNVALAIVLIVGPGRVGRWFRATFTVRRAPSGEPPTF